MGKKMWTLQDKNEPQDGAKPCRVIQAFGCRGGWNDGRFFLFTNTSWTSSSESRRGVRLGQGRVKETPSSLPANQPKKL